MKRFIAIMIGFTMLFAVLTACGSNSTESESASEDASAGTSVDEAVEAAANEVSCDVSVDEGTVAELIQVENVEIPAGSTAADFMKAIEHDTEKVNYVSYDLNDVDLDVPGEYTASVSVNIPKDGADAYVDSSDIADDADTVNLVTDFKVTVTEAVAGEPADNAEGEEEVVVDENAGQEEAVPEEQTGETNPEE